MGNASFRDILRGFLEDKNNDLKRQPTPTATAKLRWAEPPLPWLWQPTPAPSGSRPHPYPRPAKKARAKPPSPPASEPSVALKNLTSEDQVDVQILVFLGAHELEQGLASGPLKRAHRRLVKRLHPDVLLQSRLSEAERRARGEQFLLLQAAVDRLSRALLKYKISESTCGNESASAANGRRRDAA